MDPNATVLSVKDIYNVDTISSANEKAWSIISDRVKDIEGPVCLDFRGVEVIEPWSNRRFKEMMRRKNIFLQFYGESRVVDTINLMCQMDGGDKNRAISLKAEEIATVLTPAEIRQMAKVKKYKSMFVVNGSSAEMIYDFDQFGDQSTVAAIKTAAAELNKEGVTDFLVNLKSSLIVGNIFSYIINATNDMAKIGVNLVFISDDESSTKRMQIEAKVTSRVYKAEEKMELFKTKMTRNEPITLTQYKYTRAKDEYGRRGNGEILSVRIALFLGLVDRDTGGGTKKKMIHLHIYSLKDFVTREHYALTNDGDELTELKYMNEYIELEDCGLKSYFMGSDFHISAPIQYDVTKRYTLQKLTDDNSNVVVEYLTMPELILKVLNEWDIEYNHESLVAAMVETDKILRENGGESIF